MAIAGLILGVLSLVTFLFTLMTCFIGSAYFVSPFGIGFGFLGLIFSIIALRQEKTGVATGGLATSLTGLVMCTILYLSCVSCASGSRNMKYKQQVPQRQINQSGGMNQTL